MIDLVITGTSNIDKVIKNLNDVEVKLNIEIATRAFLLRELIQQALIELLHNDADNFVVNVVSYGVSFDISVSPKNEDGKRIMFGEKQKRIVSDKPMPIGNGIFSNEVTIPEVKGQKEDIERVVADAYYKFRLSLKTINLIK